MYLEPRTKTINFEQYETVEGHGPFEPVNYSVFTQPFTEIDIKFSPPPGNEDGQAECEEQNADGSQNQRHPIEL